MLDRESARRPAQVNAYFSGGSSQRDAIITALHEVGLTDDQITVIDNPKPEDTVVAAEPGLLDRIKHLFDDHDEAQEERRYDLYILAHLGQDEALATPVQDVFKQFNAADIQYYPSARPNMDVLGGADPTTGTTVNNAADTQPEQFDDSRPGSLADRQRIGATATGGTLLPAETPLPPEEAPYTGSAPANIPAREDDVPRGGHR
ncbi:MAG: hypothetical protein ACTHMU_06460 [Thermomicrobiales bacterium]